MALPGWAHYHLSHSLCHLPAGGAEGRSVHAGLCDVSPGEVGVCLSEQLVLLLLIVF